MMPCDYEITGCSENGQVTVEFKIVNKPDNACRFKNRGFQLEQIFKVQLLQD
jgi:hypothetical protein